jgi:hypothetical protein
MMYHLKPKYDIGSVNIFKSTLMNQHKLFNIPDLTNIINSYCQEYVLTSFFNDNIDKIDWSVLSLNPNAMDILIKNIDKIDWYIYRPIQML